MNKNIVIIHYNTPSLTECLVRSINLFVENAKIYIFDNSNKLPFTAKFNNVTILDNTKGQMVNFDEWLKKYSNRLKSSGKLNHWASAKHCYSVEKCMEIINDNFILLDSDVLLKRDISNLYDDNVIYSAEIIKQPRFNVKRVLPYVCFINVNMCRSNGVHFFNEDEMYGLRKFPSSDKYDTGASFYIHTEKYNKKIIKCDDYIVHYKAGSWVDDAKKFHRYKQIGTDEWLIKYKKYWSNSMNKKVIYTCITSEYDDLIDPLFITKDFDYVCFTDNKNLKSDIWEIKPLPQETEGLSQVKKQRYVKINAHKVVGEYDLSIWVDGNVEIKSDLNDFVNKTLKDDCSVYVPKHPVRKCIYAEAKACISMKKDTSEHVNKQIDRYKKEGFPENYGLLQSNIMLRKHNNEDCIKLMEEWFSELKEESHRDQLSFNYVSWKNKDVKVTYMDKMIYRSAWFFWKSGHKRSNKAKPTVRQTKVVNRYLNEIRKKRGVIKDVEVTGNTSTEIVVPTKNTVKEAKPKRKSVVEAILNKKLSTYKVLIYD